MTASQFFFLSPIKGLRSPHMNFSQGFAWAAPLEPGLTWRVVEPADRERFDEFWRLFGNGIAVWERDQLRTADTWLAGEASDDADVQKVPGQVVSFAVAAAIAERVAAHTRFMIFENRADGPSPWHSRSEDWVRATRIGSWPPSVLVEDGGEGVGRAYRHVRRAFRAPGDHAFLRAVGRFRGAVFSQFVEAMAVLLCASLEALGAFGRSEGRIQVADRLIPRYSKDSGSERDVLEQLYKLRHASAHGLVQRLSTREERGKALDEGLELTRQILGSALADDRLYADASKGPHAMKAYLES